MEMVQNPTRQDSACTVGPGASLLFPSRRCRHCCLCQMVMMAGFEWQDAKKRPRYTSAVFRLSRVESYWSRRVELRRCTRRMDMQGQINGFLPQAGSCPPFIGQGGGGHPV